MGRNTSPAPYGATARTSLTTGCRVGDHVLAAQRPATRRDGPGRLPNRRLSGTLTRVDRVEFHPSWHELMRKIGFTEAQIDAANALAGKHG